MRDFCASGPRSAKAVLALAAKMPRQRLAHKKNGSHAIKEVDRENGMAISQKLLIGNMMEKQSRTILVL